MAGSGSLAISATLYKKLPYDPAKDFAPIALVAKIPFVLVVNPSLPVNSVAELIKYAKENPGKLSFASGGAGSPHHLYAELLKSMTGIEMTHVPYKGSAPALTDVIAGHVPLMFSDTVPSLPLIRDGKVRALGVTTAARLAVRARNPADRRDRRAGLRRRRLGHDHGAGRHAEGDRRPSSMPRCKAVTALPDVQQQIIKLGMIPGGSASPEELQAFIDSEMPRWGKIVQQAGLAGSE